MVPGHTGRSMPSRRCEQTAPVGGHLQERSDLHQGVITPFQVSRRAAAAITAWCLDQSAACTGDVPRRWRDAGSLGGLWDNDQVNMIGHQAMCPDRDLLCAAESRHELEVVLVIFLTEERLLSAVSPLGDMVGHARSYHTCQSSHGGKLTRPQPRVKS